MPSRKIGVVGEGEKTKYTTVYRSSKLLIIFLSYHVCSIQLFRDGRRDGGRRDSGRSGNRGGDRGGRRDRGSRGGGGGGGGGRGGSRINTNDANAFPSL